MFIGHNLTGRLTGSYILALSMIAVLAIAGYWMQIRVMSQNEMNAMIINRAGRQRMQCQRIALYLHEAQTKPDHARHELLRSISEFEKTHAWLIANDDPQTVQLLKSGAARKLYFQGPAFLDRQCRSFIRDACTAAYEAKPQLQREAAQRVIRTAQYSLLPQLETITRIYEMEATARISELKRRQLLILYSLLAVLAAEALFIFRPLIRQVRSTVKTLTRMACYDGLTRLANHRHFLEDAARELLTLHRTGQSAALLMIDIDHFKRINDTFGHATGDAVIAHTAQILRQAVRRTDIVGRIGGEEFAVLLSSMAAEHVHPIAEKIRGAVADVRMENGALGWTVSIGVAFRKKHENGIGLLMKQADQALYTAKRNGRNRIMMYSESPPV